MITWSYVQTVCWMFSGMMTGSGTLSSNNRNTFRQFFSTFCRNLVFSRTRSSSCTHTTDFILDMGTYYKTIVLCPVRVDLKITDGSSSHMFKNERALKSSIHCPLIFMPRPSLLDRSEWWLFLRDSWIKYFVLFFTTEYKEDILP